MPETTPPQDPMIVRLPLIRFYMTNDDRVVGEVIGSTPVPPGMMNGRYLGPNGYTTDIAEATDFRGEAGKTIVQGQTVEVKGPKGDAGSDGKSAYTLWLEAGNSGSMNTFLESLVGGQGEPGVNGRPIEMQVTAGAIQWRISGGQWADLLNVADIKGPKGEIGSRGPQGYSDYDLWLQLGNQGSLSQFLQSIVGPKGDRGLQGDKGDQGTSGADGKNVEVRTDSGYIQWRLIGTPSWNNLVALADLKGAKGDTGTPGTNGLPGNPGTAGADGKSVELQVSGGYIQWRQVGAQSWTNLIATGTLVGAQGSPGADGKSAELQNSGTAIQWRQTGGTWADLVLLSALTGAKGDKGNTGDAGATLVGQVVVGQTATIAIALGIREVTATLNGVVTGQRYIAFARSYRLNGAASVAGRPPGYTILDAACNVDGTIIVSINAPLLAIGQSYAITVDIVRINAS
jgi:hypothetical protein